MGLLARDVRCPLCGGVLVDCDDYPLRPKGVMGVEVVEVSGTCVRNHRVMMRCSSASGSVRLTVEAWP